MKKAILLPYACGQNEPSKPLAQVFDIPDDVQERDEFLKNIFRTYVCDGLDESDESLEVKKSENRNDYGDIIVSYGDDLFLYVTFIDG